VQSGGWRVRLLLVDDHPGFRSAAAALLASDGWEVSEAGDGPEALAAVQRTRPDVVVLDVQLPGDDGFTVAESLARTEAPPDVVLISARAAEDYHGAVARAPVRGFIAKAEFSPLRLHTVLGTPA
jgi:CheY-like chemotaxis protein